MLGDYITVHLYHNAGLDIQSSRGGREGGLVLSWFADPDINILILFLPVAGHSPGLAIIGQYPINPKGRLVDDWWSEAIRRILLYKKPSQRWLLVVAGSGGWWDIAVMVTGSHCHCRCYQGSKLIVAQGRILTDSVVTLQRTQSLTQTTTVISTPPTMPWHTTTFFSLKEIDFPKYSGLVW